jgi:hypothetical protein
MAAHAGPEPSMPAHVKPLVVPSLRLPGPTYPHQHKDTIIPNRPTTPQPHSHRETLISMPHVPFQNTSGQTTDQGYNGNSSGNLTANSHNVSSDLNSHSATRYYPFDQITTKDARAHPSAKEMPIASPRFGANALANDFKLASATSSPAASPRVVTSNTPDRQTDKRFIVPLSSLGELRENMAHGQTVAHGNTSFGSNFVKSPRKSPGRFMPERTPARGGEVSEWLMSPRGNVDPNLAAIDASDTERDRGSKPSHGVKLQPKPLGMILKKEWAQEGVYVGTLIKGGAAGVCLYV